MKRRISIVLDDREQAGAVPIELECAGIFDVEIRRLKVGDYLVDGRFLFERKTLPDLVASIASGRLFAQTLRLAQTNGVRPALILEGTSQSLQGSGMRWEAIQGALVTVALFIGLPVLRTRSPRETVRTFEFAALQAHSLASGALARRGRRPKGKAALQRYLLQGLPGVGPERAARLIERFGSVEGVLTADARALESVPGIGRRTARFLRWAVEEDRERYDVSVTPSLSPAPQAGSSPPPRSLRR